MTILIITFVRTNKMCKGFYSFCFTPSLFPKAIWILKAKKIITTEHFKNIAIIFLDTDFLQSRRDSLDSHTKKHKPKHLRKRFNDLCFFYILT